ncbi:MAG: helix-turn-helix transcriptional regulator [Kiritimatiellae bacterium]|nr:helix-turn-helix transcriptional regulator [Kiritimatiellia bacterium]
MSVWPGVAALAAEVGMSKRSLELRFREATGETIHQRLQRMRVAEAKRLFREERVTVTEAAERVGVPDVNRFGQLFKQQTGKTPSAFRKKR